ncbi:kinase C and casein kinase substrate in neurons 1-like isoform X2, partial [Brachionus plicatilis]
STHNALNDELNREIKDWQKHNYQKTLVGQLKITKEYEEEFKKAQKPWSKKYFLVEKTKKEYHGACKSYQSAKIHLQNSQADPQVSGEQRKKLEDKMDKYKKEVEVAKNKYKQALDDLNSYNSRYIEDMNNVYKKCDQFEKERLEFFIQQLLKLHTHLNIFDKMNIEQIYAEFMGTIKQTSPDRDLHTWSKECGAGMAMSWPVFEEYSDQVKQIAKNRKKSDKDSTEGITMTSIRPIDDAETKSLSSELSNYR